jgi:hypothetical protein
MTQGLKRVHQVFLALVLGLYGHSAVAGSQQIIDGFSEFLVERANANFIAIFERRLKNDKNFQCYFPETYRKIDSIRLDNLFVSRSYWQSGLEADLETLIDRAILVEVQGGLKIIDRNTAIETIQYFEYEYEGERYSINAVDSRWEEPLKDQVNGFTRDLAESMDKMGKMVDEAKTQSLFDDICQLRDYDKKKLKELLQPYLNSADKLAGWARHIESYGKNLRLSPAGKQAAMQDYCERKQIPQADCATLKYDEKEFLQSLVGSDNIAALRKAAEVAGRIKRAYAALDALDKKQADAVSRINALLPLLQGGAGYTRAEIESLQVSLQEARGMNSEERRQWLVAMAVGIKEKMPSDPDALRIGELLRTLIDEQRSYTDRALVALELLEESDLFAPASYERLNRSVMFFVAIADAEDKSAVKATLQAYALEATSFSEKRKLGTGYFISSYLGAAAADAEMHGSSAEDSGSGLFVPIGVEYNRGFDDGDSFSLMFSPFDMAYPVNLKLNGIEEDVDMDEIVAPSITFAYGFEGYPLNIGIGYQRGRRLEDTGKAEERLLLFISLDMPLFRLY